MGSKDNIRTTNRKMWLLCRPPLLSNVRSLLMPGRFIQRLTALMLFWAYGLTGTSLVPAALAWLADLDDSHQLIVSEAGPDHTQLILHHRKGVYTPEAGDHGHLLSHVIVRLCSRTAPGDHLLATRHLAGSYGNGRDAEQRELGMVPEANDGATYALFASPLSRVNVAAHLDRKVWIATADETACRRPMGSTRPMLI